MLAAANRPEILDPALPRLAGPRRTLDQTAAILGRLPYKVHAIESVACARLRPPSTGGLPPTSPGASTS